MKNHYEINLNPKPIKVNGNPNFSQITIIFPPITCAPLTTSPSHSHKNQNPAPEKERKVNRENENPMTDLH